MPAQASVQALPAHSPAPPVRMLSASRRPRGAALPASHNIVACQPDSGGLPNKIQSLKPGKSSLPAFEIYRRARAAAAASMDPFSLLMGGTKFDRGRLKQAERVYQGQQHTAGPAAAAAAAVAPALPTGVLPRRLPFAPALPVHA